TSQPTDVYQVLYSFESLTNDPDDTNANTGPLPLTPSQLVYAAPDTTLTIGGGTLNVGVYQASAVVTFPTVPPFPASAFISTLVIGVFGSPCPGGSARGGGGAPASCVFGCGKTGGYSAVPVDRG